MLNEEQKEYFDTYSKRIEDVLEQVMTQLKVMLDEVSKDPEQAPFEHLICRIKGVDSIKEKLTQKGYPDDVSSAVKNLNDIVGIRVVTHFIGDIYSILDMIYEQSSWDVVQVKDYIATPKENGYRSLHVIIRVPFEGFDEGMGVELQLRTIAMDCWAALEHKIRYKKHVKNTALISAELKRCADEMASTDLTMQTIRDVLAQTENL
ncbi:MAG: hypothetical protein II799_01285 [Lachnospiraceae bacterium]|nr:hypothetical protein [Lachnospiraceae bacterium]